MTIPSRPVRRRARRLATPAVASTILLLAACGSPPALHYHTLVAPAAEALRPASGPTAAAMPGAGASSPASAPLLVDVQPVTLPPQVDQPQFVLRDGAEGVVLLENERWIAPLGDELRAAISTQLARRLGAVDVAGVPGLAASGGPPVMRIRVDVRRFDSTIGREAALDAVWSVRSSTSGDAGGMPCRSQLREPAGAGVEGLVLAHRRAVEALSRMLAEAVRQRSRGEAPVCPAAAPDSAPDGA